jgi:hypothetical protein
MRGFATPEEPMTRVTLLAAVAAAFLSVTAVGAFDSVKGSVTFNAEKLTPTFAARIWREAKQEISIGLFPKAVDAPMLARAVKEDFCCVDFSGGPFVVIDLRLVKGAKTLGPKAVDGCHIGFYDFKDSPFDYNTDTERCGLVAISGVVKPGGVVSVTMKGKNTTAAMGPFKAKVYDWDVAVEVTLRTK